MSIFDEIFDDCQKKHDFNNKFNLEVIRDLTGFTGFKVIEFKKHLLSIHPEESMYGLSEEGIITIVKMFKRKHYA